MQELETIRKEITELTRTIAVNYPERYRFLDENPTTISATNHPNVDLANMPDYLERLKELLRRYKETHRNGKNT